MVEFVTYCNRVESIDESKLLSSPTVKLLASKLTDQFEPSYWMISFGLATKLPQAFIVLIVVNVPIVVAGVIGLLIVLAVEPSVVIVTVNMSSAGNAIFYGQLTYARYGATALSNHGLDRAVVAGGEKTGLVNIIDYYNILI